MCFCSVCAWPSGGKTNELASALPALRGFIWTPLSRRAPVSTPVRFKPELLTAWDFRNVGFEAILAQLGRVGYWPIRTLDMLED